MRKQEDIDEWNKKTGLSGECRVNPMASKTRDSKWRSLPAVLALATWLGMSIYADRFLNTPKFKFSNEEFQTLLALLSGVSAAAVAAVYVFGKSLSTISRRLDWRSRKGRVALGGAIGIPVIALCAGYWMTEENMLDAVSPFVPPSRTCTHFQPSQIHYLCWTWQHKLVWFYAPLPPHYVCQGGDPVCDYF